MLPTAFLQRMQRMLGPEYPAFLRSYDRPRSVGLRFNPLKGADLPQLSFGLTPVPWAPHGYFYDPATRPGLHPYHEAGVYYLQEPSAMAPAVLLDAQPGELVLDLCAAPGGKSTQIAAALQGRGLLVCNEINPGRAKILARNIERLGITNALVLQETPQRIAAAFPHCFDRVLVDAPCSGEGMFRKEAAASADWSEATVAHCAARQQEILDAAAVLLKAGGRLVYSTCTFAPVENEGAIAAFCAAIRILRWKPPARLLGFLHRGTPIGPRARTQRWRRPAASGLTSCPARGTLLPCCAIAATRKTPGSPYGLCKYRRSGVLLQMSAYQTRPREYL